MTVLKITKCLEKELALSILVSKEKEKDQGVYYYDSSTRTSKTLLENAWRYKDLSIDKYGKQLAYKVAMDSAQIDSLKFELYYQKDLNSFTRQLGYGESNIKDGWKLTEKERLTFQKTENACYSTYSLKWNTPWTRL